MRLFSIPVVIACLLLSFNAGADSKIPITVGFYEFPPVSYSGDSGQAQGSAIELTRSLLANSPYQLSFKNLPPARLYLQLISGEVDLWLGIPGKPELREHVIESSLLISEATLALFYHPDAPTPTLPEDLHDRSVILINGYSYWPDAVAWLNDSRLNVHSIRTRQHHSAIAMLLRKRGDYILNYIAPMQHAQQQLQMSNLSLPYVPIHSTPGTFIASKNSAHGKQLIADLEAAYMEQQRRQTVQFDR